jgi:neutral trehalase
VGALQWVALKGLDNYGEKELATGACTPLVNAVIKMVNRNTGQARWKSMM